MPHYLELSEDVTKRDTVKFLSKFYKKKCFKEMEEIAQDRDMQLDEIFAVFNHYENIAAGIRVGAFDEPLFKQLHYSNFIKLWENIQPLVIVIRRRQNKNTIFQEMEWLYFRWKDKPIEELRFYNVDID